MDATQNCIACGKLATHRHGHVHILRGHLDIEAGWCPECVWLTADDLDIIRRDRDAVPTCQGCYGLWREKDGLK